MNTAQITATTDLEAQKSSSYLPWVVCLTASLFFFYEFIQMNMFNAINVQLMQEFSLTAVMLGKLSAIYFYANIIFLLPAGFILDRVSTKKIICTSLSICILGTFLFSCSHTLAALTVCRFLTGIGSAFCFLSCIRLASRWFAKQHMALISGLIVTMAMIGGAIAQVPLTLLVNKFGWRGAVQIDATFGLLISILIIKFVQDYPANCAKQHEEEHKQIAKLGYLKCMKQAFLSKQNWLCGIYTSLLNLPLFLLGGLWGTLYLSYVHHLARTETAFITSMIFLGTIIGSPMMGFLSDWFKTRKKLMLLGATSTLGLLLFLQLSPPLSLWSLLILFLCLGLTTSTQVISYPVVTESNTKILTATCVSIVSLCAIGGGAIFEPFFGWLIDLNKSATIIVGIKHYTAADFQFAMWLFPISSVVAFFAASKIKESPIPKLSENHSEKSHYFIA